MLRRAEEEGPQRIGTRKSFVVLPESVWQSYVASPRSLGRWLIENIPRGVELAIPDRGEIAAETPLTDPSVE